MTAMRQVDYGEQEPRLDVPAGPLGDLAPIRRQAKALGITLMPWQEYSLQVKTALVGNQWRYSETGDTVARQNGKTKIIAPLVRLDLEEGRHVLHTAQNRIIPRRVLMELSRSFKPGEVTIRFANGQEEIRHKKSGGRYLIVAPQRGIRGHDGDRLIVDEAREFLDFDFITAAEPILTASDNPQINYFSNAGAEDSVVLNALRARADDPRVGYLEWSAAPEFHHGDVAGWRQANPGLGYRFGLDRLEDIYRRMLSADNLAGWETEHLCRWVRSMVPPLVTDEAWQACEADRLVTVTRTSLGVALDPTGRRASAVLAWAQADGSYACEVVLDETDESAIDTDGIGEELRTIARKRRVRLAGYSGATDVALARFLPKAKAIDGPLYANASATFATLVEARQLRWVDADAIGEDLHNMVRKQSSGSWTAVNSDPRRPATAALAAIRAVWLASAPRSVPRIG